MAGNDKKEKEREGKRDTDDRHVCNNEEKEVPVLYSFHFICSTVHTVQQYLFFKSESGI